MPYDTWENTAAEAHEALGDAWTLVPIDLAVPFGNAEPGPWVYLAEREPWRVRPYLTRKGEFAFFHANVRLGDVVFSTRGATVLEAMQEAVKDTRAWIEEQRDVIEQAERIRLDVEYK